MLTLAKHKAHEDANDYGDDNWDDDMGIRKVYTDVSARKAGLDLNDAWGYKVDEKDDENDDDAQTVHTAASRASVDLNGSSSFDKASQVKLHHKYHQAIRLIECDKIRSWVNAVEITTAYCPIQRQYYENPYSRVPVQELRMRAVGVTAGSGFTIAFFDLEMGIILRTVEDERQSPILCMSMSTPLARQKLAPLLATGHFDGRLVLRDMQTGITLMNAISSISHPGPIRTCLVMEGAKRPLALAGSQDASGRAALYVYNFEMGTLACPVIQDHVEPITALTSVSVASMHSLFVSASMDGYIHIYDMHTCARLLTMSPENTRGPIFAMDVLPGSLTGNRPSLLLAAGMDGVIRIFNLGMGQLSRHFAKDDVNTIKRTPDSAHHALRRDYNVNTSNRANSAQGSYSVESIQSSNPNASKRPQQTYASSLRGHRGKLFAVAGIPTITLGCVSGGEDLCLRLWNVETGQQLLCISELHTEEIRSIRVTMTPRPIILSSGYDSKMVVLDLSVSKNGEHRRAMKALQSRRLGVMPLSKANIPEDGKRAGRHTLIQANMESAVGLLDKRTSIIGPSRRGFGEVAKTESTPHSNLHLPSITSSTSLPLTALEEESGDRREAMTAPTASCIQSTDTTSPQNSSTAPIPISDNRVRRSSKRLSRLEKRERKITVISMTQLVGRSRGYADDALLEDDEEVDEDEDEEEDDDNEDEEDDVLMDEKVSKVSRSNQEKDAAVKTLPELKVTAIGKADMAAARDNKGMPTYYKATGEQLSQNLQMEAHKQEGRRTIRNDLHGKV